MHSPFNLRAKQPRWQLPQAAHHEQGHAPSCTLPPLSTSSTNALDMNMLHHVAPKGCQQPLVGGSTLEQPIALAQKRRANSCPIQAHPQVPGCQAPAPGANTQAASQSGEATTAKQHRVHGGNMEASVGALLLRTCCLSGRSTILLSVSSKCQTKSRQGKQAPAGYCFIAVHAPSITQLQTPLT